MPEKQAVQTRIAEHLQAFVKDFVPKVAELRRPVLGNVDVSKAEQRVRFWQRDPSWPTDPEAIRAKELDLMGYNPDGTRKLDERGQPVEGLTREDVGLLEFPYREIDARAGGRHDDPRAQVKYMQEMAELGRPEPDPLTQAAAEIEARNRPAPEPPPLAAVFEPELPELGG